MRFVVRFIPLVVLLILSAEAYSQSSSPSITLAGLYGPDAGVSTTQVSVNAVALDSAKDIYLLINEGDGVRVVKTNPSGQSITASVHIGAAGDTGTAMALDSSGNVYVTGIAGSGTLATTSGAAEAFPAAQSSFVAEFSASLTEKFLTSTGGSTASALAIAVNNGAVYVTGTTEGTDLPVTPLGAIQSFPQNSVTTGFVESFNATGTSLTYCSYLGGPNGNTFPAAIAADANGNIYVTGSDTATGFPTINAIQSELVGSSDMFLMEQSNALGIEFSTLMGSANGVVAGTSVQLASDGTIFVGVNATTLGIPLSESLMPLPNAPQSAIVMQFAAAGAGVQQSIVLGQGAVSSIVLDANNDVWATGTLSNPAAYPLDDDLQKVGTGFVTEIDEYGDLLYSTRLGGIAAYASNTPLSTTQLGDIALASDGTVVVAGDWESLVGASSMPTGARELPYVNEPSLALQGTLTSLLANANCTTKGACSDGYVAELASTTTPMLSVSVDTAPNLTVRNTGQTALTITSVSATGYTGAVTDCTQSALASAGACNVVLSGSGSGSVTIATSSSALPSVTYTVPALSGGAVADAVEVQPKEVVDAGYGLFGDQSSVTLSNLSGTAVEFYSTDSDLTAGSGATACVYSGDGAFAVPAGGTCTMSAAFVENSVSGEPGPDYGYIALTPTPSGNVSALETYEYDLAIEAGQPTSGLSASTSAINFGTEYLGGITAPRDILMANETSSPIAMTFVGTPAEDPNFQVVDGCPDSLPAYGACVIAVTYSSTVTSYDSATLTLPNGAAVALSGATMQQPGAGGLSNNPNVAVGPASLTFGSVGIGDSTATQTVTVTNTGGTAVGLTITATSDFAETDNCGGLVAGNASCAVQVVFSPTTLGVVHGQLVVTPNGSSSLDVALVGGGGTDFNFATVLLGEQATQWLAQSGTIVTATIEGPFTTAVVNGYEYSAPPTVITWAKTSTSACASNCSVGVRFNSTSVGVQSGTLTLTITTASGTTTQTYPLTGDAEPSATLLLNPSAINFGSIPLHSTSAAETIVLTNQSTSAAPISSVKATASFAETNNCGTSLAAGASCAIDVTFAPASIGSFSGALTVTSGTTSVATQLAGNGAGDPANIVFAPASAIFTTPSGAATITLTLKNDATSPRVVTSVAAADQPAFYTIVNTCATLAPSGQSGDTCTIALSVTSVAANTYDSDALDVNVTIDGVVYSYAIPVLTLPSSGQEPATGTLTVSPAVMSFAPVTVGVASNLESLTVTNISAGTLDLTTAAPAGFSVDASTCTSLNAGESCTMSVRSVPQSANATGTGSQLLAGPQNIEINGSTVAVAGYGTPGTQVGVPAYPPLIEPVANTNTANGAATQTLVLTNDGTTPLIVTGLAGTLGDTCSAPVVAGGTCTMTVPVNLVQACAGDQCGPSFTQNLNVVVQSNADSSPDSYTVLQTVSFSETAPTTTFPYLNVSQSSQTFAPTQVGQTVTATITVANSNGAPSGGSPGLQPLTLAFRATGDFSESDNCAGQLPAGSGSDVPTCTVTVTFAPSAAGFRAGMLVVDSGAGMQTVTLGGMAISAGVSASPGTLDFPDTPVGTSSSLTTTLTNMASSSVALGTPTISEQGGGTDFTVASTTCGSSIATNATCTITIAFAPAEAAELSGTLSVSAGSSTVMVNLNGLGTAPQIDPENGPLNFGTIAVDQTATQTLTILNEGDAPLDITNVAVAPSVFTIASSTCGAAINPQGTCAIAVTYSPTAAGTNTGSLTITSNSPGSPTVVGLSGTAVSSVTFGVSPNPVIFSGTVQVGNTVALPVTVQNNGLVATTITSVTVSGTNAVDFFVNGSNPSACQGNVVAAGATCQVVANFAPITGGPETANIVITATLGSATVPMSGNAVGLAVSPGSLTFTATADGTTSAAQTLSITNGAAVALPVQSITESGADAGDFTATLAGACATLQPAASCSASVTFTPSIVGAETATLTVNSSSPPYLTALAVTVSGTGTGAPGIGVSPTSLNFGSVLVGATVGMQSVTLTNSSSSAVTIAAPAMSGANAGDYSFTSNCTNYVIAAKSSCALSVSFTPGALGARVATLNVQTGGSNSSTVQVSLAGTGSDFTITGTLTQTVVSGQTASYALSIGAPTGYNGTLTFSCAALANVPYAQCGVNPTTVTVTSGAGGVTVSPSSAGVSITTNNSSAASLHKPLGIWTWGAGGGIAMALVLPFGMRRKTKWRAMLAAMLVLAALGAGLSGCGGSSNSSGGGGSSLDTPAGTYQFTVTAIDSAGGQFPTQLTLVVTK